MSLTAVQDKRRHFRVRLAIVLSGGYLAWLLFQPAGSAVAKTVGNLLALVSSYLAAFWALEGSVGKKRRPGRSERAADLLGLGLLASSLGNTIWTLYSLFRPQNMPLVSEADAAFLACYALAIAGILLMPTRSIPASARGRTLLDSLMIIVSVLTFSWYFILGPIILQGQNTPLSKALSLMYPALDLTLLFFLLISSFHPTEVAIRRSRSLLTIGMMFYILGNSTYVYMTLNGRHTAINLINACWMLGCLLSSTGISAFRFTTRLNASSEAAKTKETEGTVLAPWRLLLPYAPIPAVCFLMAYVAQSGADYRLVLGVTSGSAALLGLVLLRQVLALLENGQLYRQLREAYRELESLATTDGMTGLANHRAFQERLQELGEAGRQESKTFALLLLDVDKFKQYNDSFGHPAGDAVLKETANLLHHIVREEDFVGRCLARYGGEEFAILLPDSSIETALGVAERVRAAVAAHPFRHREVTVSIGAACYEANVEVVSELVERADKALYAAKNEGRNRVTAWSSPTETFIGVRKENKEEALYPRDTRLPKAA